MPRGGKRKGGGLFPAKKKPCRACEGTGTKTYWTRDREGRRVSYESQCDTCQGTGEV